MSNKYVARRAKVGTRRGDYIFKFKDAEGKRHQRTIYDHDYEDALEVADSWCNEYDLEFVSLQRKGDKGMTTPNSRALSKFLGERLLPRM